MAWIDEIRSAIEGMRLIEFQYKGTWRKAEPYLLGYNQKDHLCLSAFQIEGGSGYSWRAFLVNEISNLNVTDDEFHTIRDGYNPNDSTMNRVICAL